MSKKKGCKIIGIVCCLLICILLKTDILNAKENDTEVSSLTITDGEEDYGTLYGAPYSESDDTEWLTLSLGGRGLRIINEYGDDVVLIDQYGSVYINGQRCNPDQEEQNTGFQSDFSYGFMYFLVIIALVLGGYNFVTRRKP